MPVKYRLSYLWVFFVVLLLLPQAAVADWINLSGAQNAPNIAEIHIQDEGVRVTLEIFVNDVITFDALIPEAYFEKSDIKRPSRKERLSAFSKKDLQIKTGQGETLSADLVRFEPRFRTGRPSPYNWKINPYTGVSIPGPPKDKRVFYAELVYPFTRKPASLTIIPPLDENGLARAAIGFMTFHNGVPLHNFSYLSKASTVSLDWTDPWYSRFDNKALKRWQQGGVMSFIYIEPYEVRHEILARVKDLEAWMDLGLRGDRFIEADENEPLMARVGAFLLEKDKVLIDGKQTRPILDRTAFIKYSTIASRFLSEPEQLPVNTAMIGVIITYLTDGMPKEVSCEWTLWSDRIQKVPTNAIDPAGGLPSYVTPEDNIHVWQNFLKQYTIPTIEKVGVADAVKGIKLSVASATCVLFLIPVIWLIKKKRRDARPAWLPVCLGILLIGGALLLSPYLKISVRGPGSIASRITNEEGKSILGTLLKNVYRAFDFRAEEDVYDKLAVSVTGGLLSDIYLQSRNSLQVEQAGGAQAKVTDIEVLDVTVGPHPDKASAVNLRSSWKVLGKVGHWGHIHTRENQYEANIVVEIVDGSWKITSLELLDEKRIDPYAG